MTGEIETVICPECQKNDKVFKVSQIYRESLNIFNKKEEHPIISAMAKNSKENVTLPSPYSHDFTRVFAPPAGGKGEILRALHPDLIVGILSAAFFFLIYNAYNLQQSLLLPAIIVLVLGYGLYFVFRKKALEKYNRDLAESKEAVLSVEQSIWLWKKLFFCARDGVVIEPGSGKIMPLEKMKTYLRHGKLPEIKYTIHLKYDPKKRAATLQPVFNQFMVIPQVGLISVFRNG